VSGQNHAPAILPPGKGPSVLIGYEAGWAPEDVEKRKMLTLPGLLLRPLGRPARSQSLYRLRATSTDVRSETQQHLRSSERSPRHSASLVAGGADGFQTWRILTKQSCMADKGWSQTLSLRMALASPHLKRLTC
jgi:hypothetical protein